jgi:hypothetical protein
MNRVGLYCISMMPKSIRQIAIVALIIECLSECGEESTLYAPAALRGQRGQSRGRDTM